MNFKGSGLAFVAAVAATSTATATEGGGSTYPSGVENFLVGAPPPPGLYFLGYGNVYSADKFKDDNGNDVPIPGFKVRAIVPVIRPIWSTHLNVFGGNIVFHTVFPLVDLKVDAAGRSQHKTGLGDITPGIGLATHYSPALHTVLGLDVVLPTGDYDRNNLANIGRNYVSIEPLYTLTYIDPTGFNGDFKLTFNINQRNSDTHYKSGNEVFLDYCAGWGLGNGWTVGLGGYARRQFTDDDIDGVKVVGNKARNFAIGPSVKYDNGKGWFITAKLQQETSARNTTEGTAFWLKTLIPF